MGPSRPIIAEKTMDEDDAAEKGAKVSKNIGEPY